MNHSTDHARRLGALALAALLTACSTVPQRPQPTDAPAQTPAPTEADKGDPRQRFAAAMQLLRDNQIAEAEQALTQLVQDFPEHSGPWTNLGILFARSNRRAQALGAFGKAAQLNPQNKVALNWLGILHREAGAHERARQAYERALAIDPDYAYAHYNLALLLDVHLKQPAAALPHYREYLRLSESGDLKVMAWIAEIEATLTPEKAAGADAEPQS
ncbi:tetratricopeptide repeat protein [Sinimarinibacterium thermocellulolyticum]|uniref:Tetratricopeptide repeat protein n=1 Tax=Sinimarinibacterium thermocellulolyticum TaxID=3170016 RepID=A0ABV2A561_9GAMM